MKRILAAALALLLLLFLAACISTSSSRKQALQTKPAYRLSGRYAGFCFMLQAAAFFRVSEASRL